MEKSLAFKKELLGTSLSGQQVYEDKVDSLTIKLTADEIHRLESALDDLISNGKYSGEDSILLDLWLML